MKSRTALVCRALLGCALLGCPTLPAKPPAATPPTPPFTDVTSAAGLSRTHHKPILDHQLDNINSWVSSVGAAAAAADFDQDGWMDLYVTDSRQGFPNHLYRNMHDGTFT